MGATRPSGPWALPGGCSRSGGGREHPGDVSLPGFEDDHWDLPGGPLLVAGVAFESGSNLGPKLGPLLFGAGVGDQLLTRVGPYLKLQETVTVAPVLQHGRTLGATAHGLQSRSHTVQTSKPPHHSLTAGLSLLFNPYNTLAER